MRLYAVSARVGCVCATERVGGCFRRRSLSVSRIGVVDAGSAHNGRDDESELVVKSSQNLTEETWLRQSNILRLGTMHTLSKS